jgi:5-formyltetrahydrofolate cyclo-ligase
VADAASGGVAREKAALRRRLLADRARLGPDQRAAAARALRDAILELPQAQMAGTIAAYYSLASEPGTHGLVYALWKRGGYVLLPLLSPDADLDWASYEGPDSLRQGSLGRGGGSYDRALARVGPGIPTIALLYDGELLDEVPAAAHDQRVRLVARPSAGITRLPIHPDGAESRALD